ncbi:MAG: hypothetical protein AB7F35_08450 [Acetobacteraceae bacterium]
MKPQEGDAIPDWASRMQQSGIRTWRPGRLLAVAVALLSWMAEPAWAMPPGQAHIGAGMVERVADRGKGDKDADKQEPMQAAWCTLSSMRRIPFETEILVVPPGTTMQHLFPLIRTSMQQKYLTAAVPPVKCEFARTEAELRVLQKKRAMWEMTTARQAGMIQVIDPNDFPGRPFQFIKPEKNPTLGEESGPRPLGVAQGLDPRGFGTPEFGRQRAGR